MKHTHLSNDELLLELQARLHDREIYQQQVGELNHTLKDVNQKLEEAESLKGHFISNISNELINPFTSVLAITEKILGVEKENWKKVIQMVSLIHKEVFNLDFQFKNIFAAAKLEAGKITPDITLVNIGTLIQSNITQFKHGARRKHIEIEYLPFDDTPVLFKTDAEKVQLILSNLLSNAIKYSFEGGKVIIKMELNEDILKLTVQDFGQGISEDNEKIIFDRFKRLDSEINSINRGYGLGLSIIISFIDLLNGDIHFKSNPGKGTTFTITLKESDKKSSGVSIDSDELFFKEEQF